jgi:hypothetical protein
MNENKDSKPNLRLIQGRLHCETSFKSIRIVSAPKDSPPFEVDAIALEEDTYLIMSADLEIFKPDEHIIRIMNNLLKTKPEQVGSVVVKGKNPFKFMCIVHDVNQDPTWKDEWIISAFIKIFEEAERRKVRSIAIPMIGTLHGTLQKQLFVEFLKIALEENSFNYLKCIWLIAPVDLNNEIIDTLKSRLYRTG